MKSYKTDNGGFAVKCDDIKLFTEDSTWNTRLSQIAKTDNFVYIMTHNLNDLGGGNTNYIDQILSKRPYNIGILVNLDEIDKARELKQKYPQIKIRCLKNLNAKMVLVAPMITMFSSADFASPYVANPITGYIEHSIDLGVGFHSEEIFRIMLNKFKQF